jgi:prepilin-type N-terminal cleavage/methylation domain-containing protein
MKKAFTIIELVVAVALLAMVFLFAGTIFKVSINAYRTAGANAEIMQKLRAITNQLNRDFEGLQKDGYLILRFEERNRREFENSGTNDFRADRIYYFSTGDFQSWFDPDIKSNIARVCFGHADNDVVVSKWRLARDIVLLTPANSFPPDDCNDVSFAECKVDLDVLEDPNGVLDDGVEIDIDDDANNVRRLVCQNAGEMRIEWTDGTITNGELEWDENPGSTKGWNPGNQADWPKAIKFTFTLYDSKGVIEEDGRAGRTFTHIVYLGK